MLQSEPKKREVERPRYSFGSSEVPEAGHFPLFLSIVLSTSIETVGLIYIIATIAVGFLKLAGFPDNLHAQAALAECQTAAIAA